MSAYLTYSVVQVLLMRLKYVSDEPIDSYLPDDVFLIQENLIQVFKYPLHRSELFKKFFVVFQKTHQYITI